MSNFAVVTTDTLENGISEIFGSRVTVRSSRGVAGGCINQGRRLELSDGTQVFCKQNSRSFQGMFLAEALGLTALLSVSNRVGGPRVPRPIGLIQTDSQQHLLLEWIEGGRRSGSGNEEFGRALGAMHAAVVSLQDLPGGDAAVQGVADSAGEYTAAGTAPGGSAHGTAGMAVPQFGFVGDNFIGSNPQVNTWCDSWVEFFAEYRLRYQLELAEKNGQANSRMLRLGEKLLKKLPELLPDISRPSILHGDLWSGNIMTDENGSVVIIDPAVYLGHFEADLAMMELFGGPGRSFFDAYNQVNPIEAGYRERRELYNLYHLLNHLNLFGGGYSGSVMRVLQRFS